MSASPNTFPASDGRSQPAARLRFETIRDVTAFAALGPEWDRLVCAMTRPSPFLLHGWLLEWWRHFGDDSDLAIEVAFRDGSLAAALPIFIRAARGLRVGEFLGAHESALADLLLAEGEDLSVGRELADRLRGERIDYVDLFGLPQASRLAAAVGPSRLRLVMRAEAPVLDLTAGWEPVYSAKTSSQNRSLQRRRRRQLAEHGQVVFQVARTLEELQAALEDAFRLHGLRRAGRPDDSTFNTPMGMRFHRAAIAALAASQAPRIMSLRLDGRAIAFHYFFVLQETMYVHNLGFDPAWSRFSPGWLTTLAAIEAAAAEGVRRVEFLGGTERYKMDFADRLEPLHQGLGLATSVRGRAVVAARIASVSLRMRLKRWEGLRRFYYESLRPARLVVGRLRRFRVAAGGPRPR